MDRSTASEPTGVGEAAQQQHRRHRAESRTPSSFFTGKGCQISDFDTGGDFVVTDLPPGLVDILSALLPAGFYWPSRIAKYGQLVEARLALDQLFLEAIATTDVDDGDDGFARSKICEWGEFLGELAHRFGSRGDLRRAAQLQDLAGAASGDAEMSPEWMMGQQGVVIFPGRKGSSRTGSSSSSLLSPMSFDQNYDSVRWTEDDESMTESPSLISAGSGIEEEMVLIEGMPFDMAMLVFPPTPTDSRRYGGDFMTCCEIRVPGKALTEAFHRLVAKMDLFDIAGRTAAATKAKEERLRWNDMMDDVRMANPELEYKLAGLMFCEKEENVGGGPGWRRWVDTLPYRYYYDHQSQMDYDKAVGVDEEERVG